MLQYQQWAKPLEPTLERVPDSATWYAPASEPVRKHLPRPHGGLTFTQISADGAEAPDVCTWLFQGPLAPPQRYPAREGDWAKAWEVTLVTAVDDLRWYAPASEPVRKHPPRQAGFWCMILEQSPVTAVSDLRWYQPASEPARKHLPRQQGLWAGLLEPTLLNQPSDLRWYGPASEPVRKHLPRQEGLWAGPLVVEDLMLKWYAPASEPVRRPVRPATFGVTVYDESVFGTTGVPACAGPRRRPDEDTPTRPRVGGDDEYRRRATNRRTLRE